MKSGTRIKIQDSVVCISFHANAPEKRMNPSVLSDMEKKEDRIGPLALSMQAVEVKKKLWIQKRITLLKSDLASSKEVSINTYWTNSIPS